MTEEIPSDDDNFKMLCCNEITGRINFSEDYDKMDTENKKLEVKKSTTSSLKEK